VLLPSEEKRFRKYSETMSTPLRKMLVLKKKNGHCIFFDTASDKCKIYQERPLECRLYPFLLDFSKKRTGAFLDKRYCKSQVINPGIKTKMLKEIRKINFSKKWIDAYKTMENF
jgi:Fe-S-cluster containining protein